MPSDHATAFHLTSNACERWATGDSAMVCIVDDAREVRVGLSRLLVAGGYLVCAFESAEHFLERQDAQTPGCLLLDIGLPGMTGLELQHALTGTPSECPIVFLSGQGSIATAVQAMKAGAITFLEKPIDDQRLLVAIEEALRHHAQRRMDRAVRCTIQQRFKKMTPRERQVMSHVVRGRLNKQIAADIGTGEKTVKVHRYRVMRKMGVRSVPELVRLGAQVGVAFEPALVRASQTGSPHFPGNNIRQHLPATVEVEADSSFFR
jgi:FixJ family two-component response regulator